MSRLINIIGITGPSGAGKSLICEYIAKKNIPVIDADAVYHSLLTKDSPCTSALANEFGSKIIAPDGTPDRKKLGAIVFSSEKKLQRLNTIVLHFVIDKIDEMIKELSTKGEKNVVVDAPTLIESGFGARCNYIVSVLAPRNDRIARICARDGITKESAVLRTDAQKSDSFYTDNSHHVLYNDGDVDALYNKTYILFKQILAE